MKRRSALFGLAVIVLALGTTRQAFAWGDVGHAAVALIAERYLTPEIRARVHAMLDSDTDPLAPHDIAGAATWADRYKHAGDRSQVVAFRPTGKWHYVDIELDHPDLDAACYGHPPLKPGMAASQGPARACIVDKIDQFTAELAAPETAPGERLLALKFVLHLVGDLHQPLHACDDHDAGGNGVRAQAAGFRAGSLHGYWDTVFVNRLGLKPRTIVAALTARITPAQRSAWEKGAPADWAMESFRLCRDDAYGRLGRPRPGKPVALGRAYVDRAMAVVRLQLCRAGVRLAAMLNRALATGAG
jgi:hypothetical protein